LANLDQMGISGRVIAISGFDLMTLNISFRLALGSGIIFAKFNLLQLIIGKRVVDLLLVIINFFSLGVTAEALRRNIGSKSAISLKRGPVDPKFQVEGVTILLLTKLG